MANRRAFVSSTYDDLKKHRKHVIETLEEADFTVVAMEKWAAYPEEPKVFSQERVEGCDLFILLVAYRRGFVPEGEELSVTQLEYRAARKAGIPVLAYVLEEDRPWLARFTELDDSKLQEWRAQIREEHGAPWFQEEASSLNVGGAVAAWVARADSNAGPDAAWLSKHLAGLIDEFQSVNVPLPREDRPGTVALEEVYVPLSLRIQNRSPEAAEPTWATLLARERVALLGDAGSGKSTLLRYIAVQCARRLSERTRPADDAQAPPSGDAPRIPIFLDLAAISGALLKAAGADGVAPVAELGPEHWLPTLALRLRLKESQVEALLDEGNVLLLLEGLDEVPDRGDRELLVEGILGLQRAYGLGVQNHVIVACREAAWLHGKEAFNQFERVTIQAMDRATVRAYVRRWSQAVWGEDAEAILRDLEAAFGSNPAMGDIASNPQMSTLLALIDFHGPLPKQQARIFERFIERLGRTDSRLRKARQKVIREYLMELAIAMQRSGGIEGKPFNALTVPEAERVLADALERQTGKRPTPFEAHDQAEALLEELRVDTGLIEVISGSGAGRSRDLVRFKHRTFQEYLAAWYYAERGEEELLQHVCDPAWSKVLALTAGVLVRVGEERVREFLIRVLEAPPLPEPAGANGDGLVAWAPRVAAASVCLEELVSYDLDPRTLQPAREAHDRVVPVLESPTPRIDVRTRFRIADGLGSILDPRLKPDHRWVVIPAGPSVRGSEAEEAWTQERPRRELALPEFRIQRWPVTVEEYRRFTEDAEGYAEDRWWPDEEGRRWRDENRISAPLGWEKSRSRGNRPVTGVSWWEAYAFALWWSATDPSLPPGWVVRLPTEAEWEKAARGQAPAEGEKPFPWGGEWQPELANCAATGLDAVAPVGLFPAGHSEPYGLWDMAGNVAERCLDGFAAYSGETEGFCSRYAHGHAVRGGSFASPPLDLRVSYRWGDARGRQDEQVGFRCVAVPGDDDQPKVAS